MAGRGKDGEPDEKDEQEATDDPPYLHFCGGLKCGRTVGQPGAPRPPRPRKSRPRPGAQAAAPWNAEWRPESSLSTASGSKKPLLHGASLPHRLSVLCVFNRASEEQGAPMGHLCELGSLSQAHTCT